MHIVRVLPGVWNEIDVLGENLAYYLDQGFETVVVDNGSSDGSWELAQGFLGRGVVALQRVETPDHNLRLLLRTAYNLYKKLESDWIVLADADEFIEPDRPGESLRKAIEQQAAAGYNCIPLAHMLFQLTADANPGIPEVRKRFRNYAKADDAGRAKVWKDSASVDLTFPHHPDFLIRSELRLSPRPFILRHYPFRSVAQARRKLERIEPSPNSPFGWNTHYLRVRGPESLVVDGADYTFYEDDGNWNFERRVASDLEAIGPAEMVAYYRDRGPEFLEVLAESIRTTSSRWTSEPGTLKFLGDLYRTSGNRAEADRHYALAQRLCEKTLAALAKIPPEGEPPL